MFYQQGVPTKVFLARCLSPVSNMQAETPKSASFTTPFVSSSIFPACKMKLRQKEFKGIARVTERMVITEHPNNNNKCKNFHTY